MTVEGTPSAGFADRWHPAWSGLVGSLLYLPTIGFGLVSLDDPWLVRDNAFLHELSWSRISTVLFDTTVETRLSLGAEYLPVRDLSVMLDFALWGDWFGGHHLTQVALYGLLCALAASLCLELFESRRLAWWLGAAFSVHPIHVEAVAWLSERKGVLGGALLFASLFFAVRYLRRGGVLRWLASLGLLLAAIWAKGHMVAGAVTLLLCSLWLVDASSRRRLWLSVGALAVGATAFVPVYLAGQSVGMVQAYHGGGLLETAMLFTVVHGKYLLLMMLVGPYSIAYPIGPELTGNADPWLAILGGSVLFVFTLFAARALLRPPWRTPPAFGQAWWLVLLGPVSHIAFPLQNLLADRYLLVGSWGFLLVLAVGLVRLPPRTARWVGGCWLIASVAWTTLQVSHWESSEHLRRHAISVHPGDLDSWHHLAVESQRRGDYLRALQLVDVAATRTEDDPNRWRLDHRRALIYRDLGKNDESIRWMRSAATVPQAHKAYANLGYLLAARGELDEALVAVRKAVELEPRSAHNQRALGVVALEAGNRDEACAAFARALSLEPFNEDNRSNARLCAGR